MTLSGLTVGSLELEPAYDPYVTQYTAHYPSGTSSVDVTAEKADDFAAWGNSHDDPDLVSVTQQIDGGISMDVVSKSPGESGYEEPDTATISVNLAQSGLTSSTVEFKVSFEGKVNTYLVNLLPAT